MPRQLRAREENEETTGDYFMYKGQYAMPIILILLLGTAHAVTELALYGRSAFPAVDKPYKCLSIEFEPPFSVDSVHVQTMLYNADSRGFTYEAGVGWTENVTRAGFRACSMTSGPNRNLQTLNVDWMAYVEAPGGCLTGRYTIPFFTTGTKCQDIYFLKRFDAVPNVFVTPAHGVDQVGHDAASVWVEDPSVNSFTICFRELTSFDGIHRSLDVDWLAVPSASSGGDWNMPEIKQIVMLNKGPPPAQYHYSFCRNISFAKPFFQPPVIIMTPYHEHDPNDPGSLLPANNAITLWNEYIGVNGFSFCMKDIQPLEGRHTSVVVTFMTFGFLDPCLEMRCENFARCRAVGPKHAECSCDFSCPAYEDLLCDHAGAEHANMCKYRKAMCNKQGVTPIAHAGSCRPFPLQRGRTQLNLNKVEAECRNVSYNSSGFYALLPIHVLVTVNYDGQANNIVHHAITAWTESISHSQFTTCALKAGRNEYPGVVHPGHGTTYVDWVAFQGSPKGAAVGNELIADWWDGSTCKLIKLPKDKFTTVPSVLLTSEHSRLNLRHDAATLWSEDVGQQSFKICLRELQDFDGIHKDVRVSWLAFEFLPRNIFSEYAEVYFDNNQLPRVSDNNAFCQSVAFQSKYEKTPTVLISASHNSTGSRSPDHNSIASWVEHVDSNGFRMCVKELNNKYSYDPVSVSWVALPECNVPLGVESGRFREHKIKLVASSERNSSYRADLGRLNMKQVPGKHSGGWCSAVNPNQWLQVDLHHVHVITGVATQGLNSSVQQSWVTKYELSYSKDAVTWTVYTDNNRTTTFVANADSNSVVRHELRELVEARFLSFLPLAWKDHVCMRLEVYGCESFHEPIYVHMVSSGCEDPPTNQCEDSVIQVDGIDMSLKKRGHNVVALDKSGRALKIEAFDTYGDITAGKRLDTFIRDLPDDTIVLVSVHDSAERYVSDAVVALKSVGAVEPVKPGYRGSWLLVGYKGSGPKPYWVRQAHAPRFAGPTEVRVQIYR